MWSKEKIVGAYKIYKGEELAFEISELNWNCGKAPAWCYKLNDRKNDNPVMKRCDDCGKYRFVKVGKNGLELCEDRYEA